MELPLSVLHHFFARPPVPRPPRREGKADRSRYRPVFEILETRLTPATLTVNSTADPGTVGDNLLTLREALTVVNTQSTTGLSTAELAQIRGTLGTNDTIQFQSGLRGTITLNSTLGFLTIDQNLSIIGPGEQVITVGGAAAIPVFVVNNASVKATMSGLGIINGYASGLLGEGGGIYNKGTLTVQNTLVSGCAARFGGAVYNGSGGTMTVQNCNISYNYYHPPLPTAGYEGGGIYNAGTLTVTGSTLQINYAQYGGGIYNTGTLAMQDSIILQNTCKDDGGGIYNAGALTMRDCTLHQNTAGYFGGGIFNSKSGTLTLQNSTVSDCKSISGAGIHADGNLTLANCTLSGNVATNQGGAIYADSTSALVNCTLYGNRAYQGGAIYNNSQMTLTNCTISKNTADSGGGIYSAPYHFGTTLKNTIIAGNEISGRSDIRGPVTSEGYNLIGSNAGSQIVGLKQSDLIGTFAHPINPLLGRLQNNGGPTQTMLPRLGSLARLRGGKPAESTDQRGISYPPNGPWDIGAVQISPAVIIRAVGADVGGAPVVVVSDAVTGAVVSAFYAFTPTFTGGVRVAVGDVSGDGAPDIVCGAGPGGGPQVTVYDGKTLQLIRSFYGILPSSFSGGVFVAVGDVDGDGYADIVVGADAGGGPQVNVWSGKDGSLLKSFNAFAASFTGGVRVAAGDVNGDGFADIICTAGPGGGPQVTVFDGRTFQPIRTFYAFPSTFNGGVHVAAADFNGDGLADIIVGAGAGGGPQVSVFSGDKGALLVSFFDPRFSSFLGVSTGVRVGTTLVNGRAEILVTAARGTSSLVDVYDGQTLALVDEYFAFDPSFRGAAFLGG